MSPLSTTQQQQEAVNTILSHICSANDTKWDNLKAELTNYERHLRDADELEQEQAQQAPPHRLQQSQQQRPRKPPLTKNAKSASKSSEHQTSFCHNTNLNRPIKPPMRFKNNSSPLLRLFIRVPSHSTTTAHAERKEITIWNKDKIEMDEAINRFCSDINNNTYKKEIRQTILALI